MKNSLPKLLLTVAGLGAFAAMTSSALAGAAVASDGHGGFGYAYGHKPERALRHQAIENCRERSRHPDDVQIVVSTSRPGCGVIVRYRLSNGLQHIYAAVGADSLGEAHDKAFKEAEGHGADTHPEVVARWTDD